MSQIYTNSEATAEIKALQRRVEKLEAQAESATTCPSTEKPAPEPQAPQPAQPPTQPPLL